ncbi:hypothetical protein GCM10023340_02430 [Nocardioides marinquilinus]|uniref:Bacterial Ig-like domain-containing protein n=1 Tax=Nocardioides marinquilinus TaxID=1210400 RepID=A0ABP9P619_9ACTN
MSHDSRTTPAVTRRLAVTAALATGLGVLAAAGPVAAEPAPAAPAAAKTGYTRLHTVSGWGGFDSGQSSRPAALAGRDVVAISAGSDHSLALTADGAVTGWGYNGDGQAKPPAALANGTVRSEAVDAGDHHSLALTRDGGVVAWGARGDTDAGQTLVPTGLTGVTQVSAGRYHSLALLDDGTVRAWGADATRAAGAIDEGQADVPFALTQPGAGVTSIAAGGRHSLAVDATGHVWAWGTNDQGQVAVPASLDGVRVVQVAAYGAASLALTADGRVVGWGDNGTGTVAVPARVTSEKVRTIDVGSEIAMALTRDGRLLVWGDTGTNPPAAVAAHAPFGAIAAGGRHELVLHRLPKAATRLTLAAPAKAAQGSPVKVTVRLTGVPRGRVTVHDGPRQVGVLASGSGTLVLRSLKPGRHVLTARYAGTALASSARSTARTVTILKR